MSGQEPHYRWNVNPTWEHFCGLTREVAETKESRSDIHRHHHLRAALYFAIGSIEAFLNEEMRAKLQRDQVPEPEIYARLRHSQWKKKAGGWPAELANCPVELPEALLETLAEFNALRGEITHAKALDHAIYLELDRLALTPDLLRVTTAEYMVRTLAAMQRPYPFYLHGWVFVGMGGDAHHPIVDTHNQQFMMALRHIGLSVPHVLVDEMEAWEKACMSSWEGFLEGEKVLADTPCQPKDPRFPFMPRLCKRWWDDEHVTRCGAVREYPLPRFV